MNYSEILYADAIVKGPHSLRDGRNVYYVTTSDVTDIYLRKDGTVGTSTKAEGALDQTRGFWNSREEAHTALDAWKLQYFHERHGIKEPEPELVKDIKRYTKKEFLKEIKTYI